jgi:hypothetical protein
LASGAGTRCLLDQILSGVVTDENSYVMDYKTLRGLLYFQLLYFKKFKRLISRTRKNPSIMAGKVAGLE